MGKKGRKPLDPRFLAWAERYNEWRLTVGWPKLVPTKGLQGGFFQALQGAKDHDEPFPTFDHLTAGAKAAKEGWNFTPSSAGWLLGPPGTTDRNILKVARWGRKDEPREDAAAPTPRYSERFGRC